MLAAKRFPARERKLHRIINRPGRNDRHSLGHGPPRDHALFHKTIQDDRLLSMFQAVTQHPFQHARHNRPRVQPPGRNRLVRIEIHHPKTKLSSLQSHKQRAEKRNQGRRRQRHHYIETPHRQQTQCAHDHETREVERALPAAALPERQRRYANDADVSPRFAAWKANRRIVVTAIARDYRYVMTARRELRSEVCEVLGCGNHIGVKALIQEQKLQTCVSFNRLRKSSTVFTNPSRKGIVGFQRNNFCARVMSGLRCRGSSAGSGKYLKPEFLPQIAITSSPSCLIVNSPGFPRLTGSCSSSVFINRISPSIRSET